jgi:tRNA (cmo5U34)-methyltransferase
MSERATGDGIAAHRSGWNFSGEVAAGFDTHVERSVPLYAQGHELVCGLTDFFVRTDSVVYELGCSTGELTLKMAAANREAKPGARFVGLDIEPEMIAQAETKQRDRGLDQASFVVHDVLSYDYEPSDMMVLYYTAQFVPPKARQQLFDLLYDRLHWGGALVVFEKVRGSDARFQDVLTGMYHDYKLDRGYSQEEVAAKSLSLRGVLEPFSTAGNLGMFERAGFQDVETVFRYLCFQGFLAIK